MSVILENILAPWGWGEVSVYWPIIVEGLLVAVALGLIGCFLVVRGMSLLGDALSHSVLPGIVVGFLIGGSLHSPWILVGATAVGMGAALLVETVQRHSRVKEDASLGIVFTTLFAMGVVMISLWAGQADLDPGCVLYGNIEHFVLQPGAVWPMAAIAGGVIVGLVVFYRQLLVVTFDPGLAVSLGIRAGVVHYVLMGVLSLTVVASFEAVGAILAVALLIMPGATARLWTDRMPGMLWLAGVHGVVSTLVGYWLSHEAIVNTSASGAISVAGFGIFMVSWLVSPRYGVVARWWVRRRLRRTMAAENLVKELGEMGVGGHAEGQLAVRVGVGFAGSLRGAIGRGWVSRGAGGTVELTGEGEKRSRRLARAHELWEQYLHREVGAKADHVHDAAEWVEHHLDEEEVGRVEAALRKKGETEPRTD